MTTHIQTKLNKQFTDFQKTFGEKSWDSILRVQRLLLKGAPVSIEEVVASFQIFPDDAEKLVEQLGEKDDSGKIVAFAGLSLCPTNHKFKVNDKQFYTWCAGGALLFPSWLGLSVEIESSDPINGEILRLAIDESLLCWTDPVPLLVSWVNIVDVCNIRSSFCNKVHFFASKASSEKWLAKNRDAEIFPVEDFFEYTIGGWFCC